jgi:hypothetical protein
MLMFNSRRLLSRSCTTSNGRLRGLNKQKRIISPSLVNANTSYIRLFSTEGESSTKEDKPLSPEVESILESIVKLNLEQVSELVSGLNSRLDLPDTPAMPIMPMGGMPMGGMPAAGGEA